MTAPSHLLLAPDDPFALLVLAHGAGAGMRHAFMEGLADALLAHGVATYRWDFPYMAAGRRRPDRPIVAVPAVHEAIADAATRRPDLPLFAGGKSFGGRMTSTALSGETVGPAVRGVVFLGFPLHPPGKPGTERADHLSEVEAPLLFLQGDRDKLAPLELMEPVVGALSEPASADVTLQVVEGADHGFHVLKRSGRSEEEVLEELATQTAEWMRARI